jgi:putative transposase
MNCKNRKKIRVINTVMKQKLNKTRRAKDLGISRSSLYYKPKRDVLDEAVKAKIRKVLAKHKSYGHKRIALELHLNKKRILRVMKKYGIKPYRRICRKPMKKDDRGKKPVTYQNLVKNICPIRPNVIWVTDFTYIKFHERFIYFATIMDVYTREIVGFNVSAYHNKELVTGALHHAIKRTQNIPIIIHSDQGSEYDSEAFNNVAKLYGIKISMSHKQSPWENSYQESFYAQFKVDLGFVSGFNSVEELIEGIYQTTFYYNNERIHTSLKMSPIQFKQKFEERMLRNTV